MKNQGIITLTPTPLPKGEGYQRTGESIIPRQEGVSSSSHRDPLPGEVGALPHFSPLPLGEGGRRPGEGKQGEGKHPLPENLLEFARQLRREQTDAERLLWSLLRDRRLAGLKFRRQHPVEPYIVDFYCHAARLAIELDGGQHNEPDERAKDSKRSAFLEKRGIRILRFWNNDVLQNTEGVLQAIYDTLTPSPSPRGRGGDALTPNPSPAGRGDFKVRF